MQAIQPFTDVPYRAYQLSFLKDSLSNITIQSPAVVFISNGQIRLFYEPEDKCTISKGQVFILPGDTICRFETIADSDLMVIEIPDMTAIATYFLPGFPSPVIQVKKNKQAVVTISADKLLLSFYHTIHRYMQDETLSPELVSIKSKELFYIFSKTLSGNTFRNLLAPVISEGYDFAQFVLENHTRVKNMEELALLSNYSLSGFEKQFRKTFGIAPYKWMLQQKAQRVFHDILQCTKPLKVIAEEHDFCNISHLGDFCRKHFGASPTSLRQRNKM